MLKSSGINLSQSEDWVSLDLKLPEEFSEDSKIHVLEVAKYPVTVGQYSFFIQNKGYEQKELWSESGWNWLQNTKFKVPAYWGDKGYKKEDLLVTGVSFWEAEAYANFVGARIPNELEWFLIASNNGKDRFPWGDDETTEDKANLNFFQKNKNSFRTSVYEFPKGSSKHGVQDLLGNVSEWCHHDNGAIKQYTNLAVLRGGCSWHSPGIVDNYFRDEVVKGVRDNQTGIRLVRGEIIASKLTSPKWLTSTPKFRLGTEERPTTPFRQEGIPLKIIEPEWRLKIYGYTPDREFSLYDLKTKFPVSIKRKLFKCVCRWQQYNEVKGVRIADFIREIKLTLPINQLFVRQKSLPGPGGQKYESTIPLSKLIEHDAMLVYEMDGHNLSLELGFPLRMIDFSLYGYKQVKCLGELEFTDKFEAGWWEKEKQYDVEGTIQDGTFITVEHRLK